MKDFPTAVIVGAVIVAAIWLATLGLVIAAFRARGRRAVNLAVIALGILLLGVLIKGRLERHQSNTQSINGHVWAVKTTGWEIDSRWFFAGSGILSVGAWLFAVKRGSNANEIPGAHERI